MGKIPGFFGVSDEQILGCNALEWKEKARDDQRLSMLDGHMEMILDISGKKVVMEVQRRDIVDVFSNKIGAIVIFRDVTLEREFARQLSHNANTDALTACTTGVFSMSTCRPTGARTAKACCTWTWIISRASMIVTDIRQATRFWPWRRACCGKRALKPWRPAWRR